jgi:adenylate cyclase
MNPRNFFAELKRRNVYKVAVAYLVAAWLLIQIATQVFPFFEIPNWAVRLVVLILILGFPIALVLSWAFEITPEGIKREEDVAPDESITHQTGRKIVRITIALAVIAAGLFAFQFLHPKIAKTTEVASPPAGPIASVAGTAVDRNSAAVLALDNLSADKSNEFFADSVSEELMSISPLSGIRRCKKAVA